MSLTLHQSSELLPVAPQNYDSRKNDVSDRDFADALKDIDREEELSLYEGSASDENLTFKAPDGEKALTYPVGKEALGEKLPAPLGKDLVGEKLPAPLGKDLVGEKLPAPLGKDLVGEEIVGATSEVVVLSSEVVNENIVLPSEIITTAVADKTEGTLLPPIPDFDASNDPLPQISNLLLLDGGSLGNEAGLLERIVAQISALQQEGEASGVLFNLTPEQLTVLQKELALALESGEFPESLDGIGHLISIVPAENDEELAAIEILPFAQPFSENSAAQTQLTDLLQKVQRANFDDLLQIRTAEDKFSALLRNAASLNGQLGEIGSPQDTQKSVFTGATADNTGDQGINAPALGEAELADGQLVSNGNAETPTGPIDGLDVPDGEFLASLGLDGAGVGGLGHSSAPAPTALNGLQNLSHVTTQARHASMPHPGTAIVAANLRGSMALGENRVVTLQLDPPELGRVEVRLEFGSDKTLKTTVISEKPEAHFMLQRDAQALERALQESGLNADGSSLNFELADDGQGFGSDGGHDGSRNQSRGGGKGGDEDLEIIETTMNWQVDPDTGHMHYNILV